MKLLHNITYRSLPKNPRGWAEFFANSKIRVVMSISFHVFFILCGLAVTYELIEITVRSDSPKALIPYVTFLSSTIIVGFGIILPSMYIYALHRLLKLMRESEN